ncbi:MAG: hypothetical protein G01um101438_1010 [Parcubacteria group bacterium Gr01-1014_38]|nr:MAG: hypothetical protein G01um101438_1010 [Parcubacteria group bacterium Gr01-1014_38]
MQPEHFGPAFVSGIPAYITGFAGWMTVSWYLRHQPEKEWWLAPLVGFLTAFSTSLVVFCLFVGLDWSGILVGAVAATACLPVFVFAADDHP